MLQWKNFLIRGRFQDMRAKYAQELAKGDTRITAILGAAQRAFAREKAMPLSVTEGTLCSRSCFGKRAERDC